MAGVQLNRFARVHVCRHLARHVRHALLRCLDGEKQLRA